MPRWLCLLLSAFALVGLLAAAPCGAMASGSHHAHHCCPGMDGAHQGKNDRHTNLPDCCVLGVSAWVQPASPVIGIAVSTPNFADAFELLRNAPGVSGQLPPPDLRPPIV